MNVFTSSFRGGAEAYEADWFRARLVSVVGGSQDIVRLRMTMHGNPRALNDVFSRVQTNPFRLAENRMYLLETDIHVIEGVSAEDLQTRAAEELSFVGLVGSVLIRGAQVVLPFLCARRVEIAPGYPVCLLRYAADDSGSAEDDDEDEEDEDDEEDRLQALSKGQLIDLATTRNLGTKSSLRLMTKTEIVALIQDGLAEISE